MRPRRSRLRIAALLLLASVLGGAVASIVVGGALAEPVPRSIGPAPPELRAEQIVIPSASGSELRGWFVRGQPNAGGVLLLHGVGGNRTDMLGRARFLCAAGYSVLLPDFQAHGESPGDRITFGHLEALDAEAALDYLARELPGQPLAAIGTSLGGAALVLGSAHEGLCAVVLEALYPTLEEAVANRIERHLGPVGRLLTPLLTLQVPYRLGVSGERLRPIDRMPDLACPVLLIAGDQDRHTTAAESRRLYAATQSPKELWLLEGAVHEDLHRRGGAEYERRVLAFLERCR